MKRIIFAFALVFSLVAATSSQGLLVVQRRRQVAAPSGPVLVQQAISTDAGGAPDAGFGAATTPGNSVIACISYLSTSTIGDSPQLDADGPLTQGPTSTVAGITTEIWYLHNITTNGDCLFSVNVGRASIAVSEWSGLGDFAPVTNSNSALASSTVTTNSVTPATAANLVIAIGGWTADDYSTGPTNGFTRMTRTGGGAAWQEEAYLIQAAATTKSTGWGLTAGINWAAVIAAFKGA